MDLLISFSCINFEICRKIVYFCLSQEYCPAVLPTLSLLTMMKITLTVQCSYKPVSVTGNQFLSCIKVEVDTVAELLSRVHWAHNSTDLTEMSLLLVLSKIHEKFIYAAFLCQIEHHIQWTKRFFNSMPYNHFIFLSWTFISHSLHCI